MEFRDLLSVLQDDTIFADEVDTANVAIEIDSDTGPVELCGDLFDVSRFASAVVPLHHDSLIVGEASKDSQRRMRIKAVTRVTASGVWSCGCEKQGHDNLWSMPNSLRASAVESGLWSGLSGCIFQLHLFFEMPIGFVDGT